MAEVLNFLIAGRDTTAQALAWTIFCISGHHGVEAGWVEGLGGRVVGATRSTCGPHPELNWRDSPDVRPLHYSALRLSEPSDEITLLPCVDINLCLCCFSFCRCLTRLPHGSSLV